MLKAFISLVLIMVLSAPAHAGPDRVSILLGSRHPGAARTFEQTNPGIFVCGVSAPLILRVFYLGFGLQNEG